MNVEKTKSLATALAVSLVAGSCAAGVSTEFDSPRIEGNPDVHWEHLPVPVRVMARTDAGLVRVDAPIMSTWETVFGQPVFVDAGDSVAHIVVVEMAGSTHTRVHPVADLLVEDSGAAIKCDVQVQHARDELGVNHALAHCLGLTHAVTGITQWPTESGAVVTEEDAAAVLGAMNGAL